MAYFQPKAHGGNPNSYQAVVPDDMQPIRLQIGGHHAEALFIGTSGDVSLTGTDGKTAIFKSVPSGTYLPIHAVTLNAAGTTAQNIVAVYRV